MPKSLRNTARSAAWYWGQVWPDMGGSSGTCSLACDLCGSECTTLAPECLPSLAGGGDSGAVGAIFESTDIGQVAGAIATNCVGCGDFVHFVSWLMSHSDGLVSTRITGGRPLGRFGLAHPVLLH